MQQGEAILRFDIDRRPQAQHREAEGGERPIVDQAKTQTLGGGQDRRPVADDNDFAGGEVAAASAGTSRVARMWRRRAWAGCASAVPRPAVATIAATIVATAIAASMAAAAASAAIATATATTTTAMAAVAAALVGESGRQDVSGDIGKGPAKPSGAGKNNDRRREQ